VAALRPQGHHQLSAPRVVTVGVDRLGRWIDGFADRHGPFVPDVSSDTVVLTASDGSTATIEVPFPPLTGARVTDLIVHARRDRRIGVLLVRRAGFAVGVFMGATLQTSKVGSSYVQGTTKAGGWSQQRYARRRDNQATAAFAQAADQAVRILLPAASRIEALFCGGDRKAVDATLADERLAVLRPLVANVFFAVPDPRLRVLQALPEQFLAVRIQLDP
jgi:Actinobacteria/chloroflexi VLRF1 release factor